MNKRIICVAFSSLVTAPVFAADITDQGGKSSASLGSYSSGAYNVENNRSFKEASTSDNKGGGFDIRRVLEKSGVLKGMPNLGAKDGVALGGSKNGSVDGGYNGGYGAGFGTAANGNSSGFGDAVGTAGGILGATGVLGDKTGGIVSVLGSGAAAAGDCQDGLTLSCGVNIANIATNVYALANPDDARAQSIARGMSGVAALENSGAISKVTGIEKDRRIGESKVEYQDRMQVERMNRQVASSDEVPTYNTAEDFKRFLKPQAKAVNDQAIARTASGANNNADAEHSPDYSMEQPSVSPGLTKEQQIALNHDNANWDQYPVSPGPASSATTVDSGRIVTTNAEARQIQTNAAKEGLYNTAYEDGSGKSTVLVQKKGESAKEFEARSGELYKDAFRDLANPSPVNTMPLESTQRSQGQDMPLASNQRVLRPDEGRSVTDEEGAARRRAAASARGMDSFSVDDGNGLGGTFVIVQEQGESAASFAARKLSLAADGGWHPGQK